MIGKEYKIPLKNTFKLFQAKADFQTGNVTGSYDNTHSKITFNCPQEPLISCEKSNQEILLLTSLDSHQDQTRSAKCKTSTPKADSDKLDKI